jgi:hypothetical protein
VKKKKKPGFLYKTLTVRKTKKKSLARSFILSSSLILLPKKKKKKKLNKLKVHKGVFSLSPNQPPQRSSIHTHRTLES